VRTGKHLRIKGLSRALGIKREDRRGGDQSGTRANWWGMSDEASLYITNGGYVSPADKHRLFESVH
jgi:hypothetical protein